jgi:hypothetical protein
MLDDVPCAMLLGPAGVRQPDAVPSALRWHGSAVVRQGCDGGGVDVMAELGLLVEDLEGPRGDGLDIRRDRPTRFRGVRVDLGSGPTATGARTRLCNQRPRLWGISWG